MYVVFLILLTAVEQSDGGATSDVAPESTELR